MVDLTGAGKNYKIESKMHQIAKNRRAPQRRCGACGDGRGHATPRVGRREFQATQHLEPTPRARDGGPAQKARKGYYNVKYDDGDSESNVATACLALVQSAEEDAAMRRGKGAGTKCKAPVDSGSNNGQKKQRKG